MKSLQDIRRQLADGDFVFSRHAFRRAVERNISDEEIREAAGQVMLIEDYPTDKYSASCLLCGWTVAGRPLHLHVSRADADTVTIITLYQPDPDEWDVSFTRRR
ncbi:MAG: DUF4258 domain-containing protein [Caldilineae bacterium]|nr:DUF4258 domain-containing protein [Anaerolineae bacterium]MCB9154934.1 DUF4258 domain-containing protein [Caldilineae bacterium]